VIKNQPGIEGYDIIGDIHGCTEPLVRLLVRLGYCLVDGIYQHPQRQVVFVGDIIDRGPDIREALHLVRNMVDTGSAHIVLGNHEYNAVRHAQILQTALAEGTDSPAVADYPRLMRLMSSTLEQFTAHPHEFKDFIDWFSSLPLFLEGPGFRVVHACWDESLISEFKRREQTHCIHPAFIRASKNPKSFAGRVVDRLTRGTSMPLPEGMSLKSKDGFVRRFFRTKFWSEDPQTYGDVVFQPDPLPYDLTDHPIKGIDRKSLVHYDKDAVPVFFGHYWLKGRPRPLQPNIACLDYSAVNYGRLTAYRFDGEMALDSNKYVWVYVDRQSEPDS
jgi:Calcineurin-like phosphoesterase